MKIGITGAAGFVGSTLCRLALKEGHSVRALDNFHKGNADSLIELARSPVFEFMYGDVTNYKNCREFVEGLDAIIHLAAIVGFPACKKHPALAREVNLEGTRHLIKARNHYKDIPFVNASTGSVYGVIEDICTEESFCNPASFYGEVKLDAERIVIKNSNTVSFRFATGFGVSPNMRINLLVNDFVYQALVNGHIEVFQPHARRTFIHVRDMSRAFLWGIKYIKEDGREKVFNCGDNKLNWTKGELVQYVMEKTGCRLYFEDFAQDEDKRDYEVSYKRINDAGFHCMYSMEQGIDELIKAVPMMRIIHQYE